MMFFILLFIAIALPVALVVALSPNCNRHHDDRRSPFREPDWEEYQRESQEDAHDYHEEEMEKYYDPH